MATILESLIGRLRGHTRPCPDSPAAATTAESRGETSDESALTPLPLCAWCERPVMPGDHYVDPTDGAAVHKACRHAEIDEKIWLCTRRAMINELRPAYLALGRSKEAQNLVFRLYPTTGVSLEDAFGVLRELERCVRALAVHDFRTSADALAAIRAARRGLQSYLPA
ncbi:MAG TPA: hypothetical protein VN397_02165 [Candidatus Methylomirabilis sp.]|nr:hypothetical protein [Candidatus Methylomirabilis sp.]